MSLFSPNIRQACTFILVALFSTAAPASILQGSVVAPYSTLVLDLPGHTGNKVSGSFVNDYGSITPFDAVVK
jgi:chaperone protein EcpD